MELKKEKQHYVSQFYLRLFCLLDGLHQENISNVYIKKEKNG